jgi:two-component system CheB/CheR fusion protein
MRVAEPLQKDRKLYDLVVVGSSAGGIEAQERLVSTLPTNFPAPLVLAQHLGPDRPSHLADILARQSALPVHSIEEGSPVLLADGTVYVVPADQNVEITDHSVVLRAGSTVLPKPSINLLLASAAHSYGERLIAVILTGTGSDGAIGAQAVKAAGGTVIIENPDTARYPDMPASVATSSVDMSLDLAQIGPILYDLLTGAQVLSVPGDILPTIPAEARAYSGIDFSLYKQPTILRRLQRRLTATGATTFPAYVAYLHHHPEEYTRLSASFLIKVTGFFRDRPIFDYLREEVIAEIISRARKQHNRVRIWSAGCATGEEAYSLAILIAEYLGDELDDLTVQIFATDADADVVAFARRGVYSAAALASVPEAYGSRYFAAVDNGWAVSQRVRGMVIFGEHDLGQRAPFPHIDLVVCRNVLIYFTPELQKRALQLFAFSLHDGSYLVLGMAETTTPLPDYFAPVQPHLKAFRRQGGRIVVPLDKLSMSKPAPIVRELSLLPTTPTLPAWLMASESERAPATASATAGWQQSQASHAVLGEQILSLALGIVVVDRNYDVQAINDAAYTLLEINRMAGGRDILHLASRTPTRPFRGAIDAAFHAPPSQGRAPAIILELTPGEPRSLEVTCLPHRQKESQGTTPGGVDAVVILITDVTGILQEQRSAADQASGEALPRTTIRRGRKRAGEPSASERTVREEQLESGLAQALATVRDVNATIQELRDANQELRQENEQLRLREEEARASSEEVKTLNEELQANNEEFETINEELEATLEELRTTNDDLQARTKELEDLVAQRDARAEQLRQPDGREPESG